MVYYFWGIAPNWHGFCLSILRAGDITQIMKERMVYDL